MLHITMSILGLAYSRLRTETIPYFIIKFATKSW